MRRVLRLAALVLACGALGVGFGVTAQAGNPGTPPGQAPCDHGLGGTNGNAGPCNDDPQPARGQDCEEHGISGGMNEDHCIGDDELPAS